MKKILTVLAIAFATTAMAQGGSPAGNHEKMTVEKRLEQMTTELSLTKTQKKKVKALLEEQDKQHANNYQAEGKRPEPGRNNNGNENGQRPPRGEKPNGQQANNDEPGGQHGNSEFDTKLKKILTAAQWKKWEAKKQEAEKSFQQNGNHKRNGNAPASNNNDYRK